jgi:hypothetical protein
MVGDADDAVVSSIERTEASAAEVLQAVQWFRGAGGLADEAGHEPHGVVRAVCEIPQVEELRAGGAARPARTSAVA